MGEAEAWIERLGLVRHPEGGWYRETYRAAETIDGAHLPARFDGARALSTAIYFLLRGAEVSHLHRIKSDEVWHFYAGGPVVLSILHGDGRLERVRLGARPDAGERFQAVVAAGCWYGAALADARGWALLGGTVAPGFDFADFELAGRDALVVRYPQHRAVIEALTRA